MKFYNRDLELGQLETLHSQIHDSGKLSVITGRRRIGKTLVAQRYADNKNHIYFFISKKSEKLLCEEFVEILKRSLRLQIFGEIRDFKSVFELVLQTSVEREIILIVDEFQEFYYINPAVYSQIQNLWDQYKARAKIHVIFIGSVYSLMTKIFLNNKEPLFGRADRVIYLKPFAAATIKKILSDKKEYNAENLFYNYLITGGVPRYQEILVDNEAYTFDQIVNFIFQKDSPFLPEGRSILIEEFGKEYLTYFSILELLAQGRTSRGEIESILEKNIGGFIDRLQNEYDIVSAVKPMGAKQTGRIQKYRIKDNFLNFWFRYIYRYHSAIESDNYNYLKRVLQRDISTYSGPYLERLFQHLLAATGEFNEVGSYWERENRNEIDIVAVNDLEKKLLIAEVKLNAAKINMTSLREKSRRLVEKYPGYQTEYEGLSLSNIEEYL